eukprot:gnl/Ergobibamus_cyprinoides/248.p1 GENE.gnl/Ergobibamus_cyprinoides/248~~gnl/Ergobibamus_cyprinoides/248.p1  ORF type:complete len:257 (+),score=77.00 gnl/Ergobibamus_cyprinoides/248:659-1429(+)
MNVSLTVAVDFTGSNGNPTDPSSLHFTGRGPTQYESAIGAIGSILAPYDSDGMIAARGFGGVPPGLGRVSHCFPLHPAAPELPGVAAVCQAYREALAHVVLSGPTLFAPLLEELNEEAARAPALNYHVLLLCTDGQTMDMQQTITQIVAASKLPVSIIIAGIGNADFSAMDELDADTQPLVDSHGLSAVRDCVQFVQMNAVSSPEELAAQTLRELPGQVVQYFASKGIKPNEALLATPAPAFSPSAPVGPGGNVYP